MKKEEKKGYPTDLTDEQWAEIEPLFVGMRNANGKNENWLMLFFILWIMVATGVTCQMIFRVRRQSTFFFRRANKNGLWDKILEHMVKVTGQKAGRNPDPSYALIDSQSTKTVYASEQIGFDGEKTKGRKRHIVTDTLGCLLAVKVHRANLHDTKAGIFPVIRAFRKYLSPTPKLILRYQRECQ